MENVELLPNIQRILDIESEHNLALELHKFAMEHCGLSSFLEDTATQPYNRSLLVAQRWYAFSKFVPRILIASAHIAESEEQRSRLISIANDELGNGETDETHAKLFLRALFESGIELKGFSEDSSSSNLNEVFDSLLDDLGDSSIAYGLGMLCGLEIPAEEIVELLVDSLGHNEATRHSLSNSHFFVLHRQIEKAHKLHFAEHYILFCKGDNTKQRDFALGVERVLKFWKEYWGQMATALA